MIVTAGELLVEFVSHTTGCGLSAISTFSGPYPSGAPAIFIDQAARVGAKAAIIGSVGFDPFGDLLIERLKQDGVDTNSIKRSANGTTGTAFVSYYQDGSRTFVFHLDGTAADQFTAGSQESENATLHVSGSSLGNPAIRKNIMRLVEQFETGGRISFDPNVRPELMKDASVKACIEKITDVCDILIPSEADLEALCPSETPETFIKTMLEAGKSAVVVKRGGKGAVGSNGGELIRARPVNVEEVDPTGAGDCFCGTLLGLLDQDSPFIEALAAANIAGALHVTRRGPMEWNPTLSEIEAHLEREGGPA